MSVVRVPCPRCGKVTETDDEKPLAEHFPFCSELCRLVDLGKWFAEEYRVEGGKPGGAAEPPAGDDPDAA